MIRSLCIHPTVYITNICALCHLLLMTSSMLPQTCRGGRFPCRWSSVGAAGMSEMAAVRQSSPGWITEATCCQQPPLCRCVPVKASAWQQACDLAPNTTPRREARPGVTEPLTGCSPSFHHSLTRLRFSFLCTLCTKPIPSATIFAATIWCCISFYVAKQK